MRTIRSAILFFTITVVLLFWSETVHGSTNVCGSITTNTTWNVAGSPYIATCGVTVNSNVTLTVDAGVTVKFNSTSSLVVNGTMVAIGTTSDPISFTSNAGTPTRGSWRGIHFQTGSSASQLSYVNVTWGGASIDGLIVVNTDPGPAMDHLTLTESSTNGLKQIIGWSTTVSDSVISNCTTRGITVVGGQLLLSNTTVSSNGSYGIYVDVWAFATLTNVTINNNTDYAIGAIRNAQVTLNAPISVSGNGGGSKNAIGYTAGGDISSSRTWDSEIPIVVLTATTIGSNVTLTINPGATIKFASSSYLQVNGTLSAVGSVSQPISFTTNAATPTRGSWRGIYFQAGSSASQLSYVTVSWGGTTSLGYDASVAVNTDPGPAMDHVTITESANNGLKHLNGWPTNISDSTISNCTTRGITIAGGRLNLTNVTVSNNGGYGAYVETWGILDPENLTINNNTDYAIGTIGNSRIHPGTIFATGNGGGAKNAISYSGGTTITLTDVVWRNHLPRVVLSSIVIGSAGVLTIEPGTTVKFASSAYLQAQGKLTAIGTSSEPILFTTNATTPTRGSWRGMYFEAGSSASQLSYVTVSWGGATNWSYDTMLAVDVNPGPAMDHLTVTESSTNGIKMLNGWPLNVSESTISNCTSRGITIAGGQLNLTNTVVSNNGSYGIYVDRYAMLNSTGGALTNNVDYAIGSYSTARIAFISAPTVSGNGSGNKNAIGFNGGPIDGMGAGVTITWDSEVPTVVLVSPVIGAAGILAIAPGATVKFAVDKYMEIAGRLTAIGTAQQPILFTSNATSPSPGSWAGLYFQTGSSGNHLKYTTLSYAGDAAWATHDGSIVMDGGVLTLEYSTINYSATKGIKILFSGTPTANISHCAFMNNTGGGIANENETTINAKLNYWNSTNGPSGAGPGSGQSISTKVQYDPFFAAAPVNPHLFSAATVINQTFNPANGVNISIPFETLLTGNWTATFKNAIGTVVRTYTGSGQTATVVWDGRDSSGTLLLDGIYNFELQSVASPSGEIAASIKGAAIVIDSTRLLAISSFTASEFFSPNNDGIQENTTIQASFNFDDVNWTMNIRNSSNTIVRSNAGQGPSFTFVWDGKDAGGILQPEGAYLVELLVQDGSMNGGSNKPATLDITFPVSQIVSPNGGGILSNFYQGGSIWVGVTANSTDLNHQNWLLEKGFGASPSSWSTLAAGVSPASSSFIFDWETGSLDNGTYTLRLQTWDKAGNRTGHSATLTVGNFKVSMNTQQINAVSGQTVQYTSVLPFTLTETLVIKNRVGAIVRTLVNGVSRNAGNHVDSWNGKTAAGAYLPTDGYFYVATITDGTTTMILDLTDQIPTCHQCGSASYPAWDPFNNVPLTMLFNVGGPKIVTLAFSPVYLPAGPYGGQILAGCDPPNFCRIQSEYREGGDHTYRWAGVDNTGALRPEMIGYVIEKRGVQPNAVIVFGTRLGLPTGITASPPLFNPRKESQSVSFNVASFQNQQVSVTARFINQDSLSILRTFSMTGVNPGTINITWDGKADNGMWVSPGRYTVTIDVTDSLGHTATEQILTTVRY